MKVGLHTLALVVQRIDLPASAIFLDTTHLPAFVGQQLFQLLFGLPATLGPDPQVTKPVAKTGVATRAANRVKARLLSFMGMTCRI